MTDPYREPSLPPLTCPRCKKQRLPPLDVASCPADCGTWVSAFVAPDVLTEADLRPNRHTRWWRVREPCPICERQMQLCNEEPGLLLGCERHGYFIDADTVASTGLARGVDEQALQRKRDDPRQLEVERERLAALDRADAVDEQERDLVAARVAAASRREADYYHRNQRIHSLQGQLADPAASRVLATYLVALEDQVAALDARIAALEKTPRE